MVKEMTVAEIERELGYEIEVIDEPLQAGEVVDFGGHGEQRLIVSIDGQLCAVDANGVKHCGFGTVEACNYVQTGKRLSDFIK